MSAASEWYAAHAATASDSFVEFDEGDAALQGESAWSVFPVICGKRP